MWLPAPHIATSQFLAIVSQTSSHVKSTDRLTDKLTDRLDIQSVYITPPHNESIL